MTDAVDDDQGGPERSTAPQSDYSREQVLIGFAVLLVGVVVAYFVPGLL